MDIPYEANAATAKTYENKNIVFELATPADKKAALAQLLSAQGYKRAVVFCFTKEACEQLCEYLSQGNLKPVCFIEGEGTGADLSAEEIIITNAARARSFGEGVELTVHFDLPLSMQGYLAFVHALAMEKGRAVFFYSGRDVVARHKYIATLNEEEQEAAKAELSKVIGYCHAARCLRAQLATFASGEEMADYCGACSVCKNTYEERDITDIGRIIFACVFKMGRVCTYKTAVAVLQGSKSTKLRAQRLHLLPTYGLLADMEEEELRETLAYLVKSGYLSLNRNEGSVLSLTAKAQEALQGGEELLMRTKHRTQRASARTAPPARDQGLISALRARREVLARQAGLPVYAVFTDGALSEIAGRKPTSRAQLQKLHGISETSLRRFSDAILESVKNYLDQKEAE